MHRYKVGWEREDGSFNSMTSVGADNKIDAQKEAERQLNRIGRRGYYLEWVKRGSQVKRVDPVPESGTINNRYQVFCTYCGQLSTERTKRDAMSAATAYVTQGHFANPCYVRVADLMAHVGSVELWRVTKEGIGELGRRKE